MGSLAEIVSPTIALTAEYLNICKSRIDLTRSGSSLPEKSGQCQPSRSQRRPCQMGRFRLQKADEQRRKVHCGRIAERARDVAEESRSRALFDLDQLQRFAAGTFEHHGSSVTQPIYLCQELDVFGSQLGHPSVEIRDA